jgi:hypothetical protein
MQAKKFMFATPMYEKKREKAWWITIFSVILRTEPDER